MQDAARQSASCKGDGCCKTKARSVFEEGTFFLVRVFMSISAIMAVHSHSSTTLWMCSTHL